VVDSSPDDEDDEDDEMEEPEDEDAEGEEDMDVDAEGEDAEGDVDMDVAPPSAGSTIKIARPSSKPSARAIVPDDDEDDEEEDDDEEEVDDDDDDGDLSDPADSDAAEQTLGLGDETMADEDAEGEEIDEEGATQIDGQGQGLDSDDEDGSQDGELDLAKMTKRQRARFEDGPQEFMKLSDGELMPFPFIPSRGRIPTKETFLQRCKQRRYSLPKSYPCGGKKWPGAGGI
jgi:Ino eighty subunit 2